MNLTKTIEIRPPVQKGAQVMIWFSLSGDKGCVSLAVMSGWYTYSNSPIPPSSAGISIHAYEPLALSGEDVSDSCEWLGGEPCYNRNYCGSASYLIPVLKNEGSEAVFAEMYKIYKQYLG